MFVLRGVGGDHQHRHVTFAHRARVVNDEEAHADILCDPDRVSGF
jgi:hypothetical protein